MNIVFGLLFLFNAYASVKSLKNDLHIIRSYDGFLRILCIVLSTMFGLVFLFCEKCGG